MCLLMCVCLAIVGDALCLTGALSAMQAMVPRSAEYRVFDGLDAYMVWLLIGSVSTVCIPYNYVFSMQVESALGIEKQLEDFRVDEANCYNPEDRKRIASDISGLYGSVSSFETSLRSAFLPAAKQKMGSSFFPFKSRRAAGRPSGAAS